MKNNHLKSVVYTGKSIKEIIPDLAKLRIEVFHDFPYLYEGNLAYEENYLSMYVESKSSVCVALFEGDTLVGASTGLKMTDAEEEFQEPFLRRGFNLDEVFYFGESVLSKRYRGQGYGKLFFKQREAHARRLEGITTCTFCAVERDTSHPARPQSYRELGSFWQAMGYAQQTDMYTHYAWTDVGHEEETSKKMVFWLKNVQ